MASSRPEFPALGIRTRSGDTPHILILERIPPSSVEMVYSMAYWWQTTSSSTVSVINVWPLDTYGGIPASIDLQDFDAVLIFPRLGYDVVALQFLDRRLQTPLREYDGVKVLMRQDENLLTGLIEDFLIDNDFDLLFSCVPVDQVPIAYPRLEAHGVAVHSVLSGYVTPDMRTFRRASYEDRTFDISYRAHRGGLQNGRLVFEKYQIGVDALTHLSDSGLVLDISLDPARRLVGKRWRDRLNDTRCVLGTESGSNLFDFDGAIYRWAEQFRRQYGGSSLGEAEIFELARSQFVAVEGNVKYAQISPRHLEAAAFGSMQLLLPGGYSGIFEADRHYLELRRDFSNASEIVEAIKDPSIYQRITDCAFEEIVMNPGYWIETAVLRLDGIILATHDAKRNDRTVNELSDPQGSGRYDVARGRLVQLVSVATTVRPIPYYFDADLDAAGGACVRIVLDTVGPPFLRRNGRYPWIELSLHHWVPSQRAKGAVPPVVADVVQTLAAAAEMSSDEIVRQFGGYDDSHGSLHGFQADCRLALRAVWAGAEWIEGGFRPGAVMASDPVSLPGAVALAAQLDLDVYVDVDGFARVLDSLQGWQAHFWENLAHQLVRRLDRCVVLSSPDRANNAHDLVGLEPTLGRASTSGEPGCWGFLTGRPGSAEVVGAGDAEGTAGRFEAFRHPKMRSVTPSLDVLTDEVLPLVERSFGVGSSRYRSVVIKAITTYRSHGDRDAPYRLLFHAIRRWVDAGEGLSGTDPLTYILDERRSLILNSIMAVDAEMPLVHAQTAFDQVESGEILLSSANRLAAWKLLNRLLMLNDNTRWTKLYEALMTRNCVVGTGDAAADAWGLQVMLGHFWARRDYVSARPIADALLVIRDAEGADSEVGVGDGTLARINVVRSAVGWSETPALPIGAPADGSQRGASTSRPQRLAIRAMQKAKRRVISKIRRTNPDDVADTRVR